MLGSDEELHSGPKTGPPLKDVLHCPASSDDYFPRGKAKEHYGTGRGAVDQTREHVFLVGAEQVQPLVHGSYIQRGAIQGNLTVGYNVLDVTGSQLEQLSSKGPPEKIGDGEAAQHTVIPVPGPCHHHFPTAEQQDSAIGVCKSDCHRCETPLVVG